jgi:predicted HTH transcriptional regulator
MQKKKVFISSVQSEFAEERVTLYNNRLEIWNPGQLPYGLTPEMLKGKHKSFPANPLIARPLYLYGSIEQVGTGTEMLVKQCLEQGLRSPDFENVNDFNVIFWRNEEVEGGQTGGQTGETSDMALTEIQEKIISIIQDKPKISRKELSNLLNINTSAIQKHIEKLKQLGLLERKGADFGGYWKIIDKK